MKTFTQYLEARFQPAGEVKPISEKDLLHLIDSLAKNTFGPQNVDTAIGWGGYVDIKLENRHFRLSVDSESRCEAIEQLPEVYIAFDWLDKHSLKDTSDKENSSYYVRRQIERDTMEYIHKIRDGIIRPLSNYALTIFFYPIGERREKLYSSLLMSSGFKSMECRGWTVWIPINLKIPSPSQTQPS